VEYSTNRKPCVVRNENFFRIFLCCSQLVFVLFYGMFFYCPTVCSLLTTVLRCVRYCSCVVSVFIGMRVVLFVI
jgi:hypothetical protein